MLEIRDTMTNFTSTFLSRLDVHKKISQIKEEIKEQARKIPQKFKKILYNSQKCSHIL